METEKEIRNIAIIAHPNTTALRAGYGAGVDYYGN